MAFGNTPPPGPITGNTLTAYAAANEVLTQDKAPKDKLWIKTDVTTTNWNKTFPYQLMVVDKIGDIYTPKRDAAWIYTLPVPPEALSISSPFAIQTSITLGGSIEEHNGIPVRTLHVKGTFGVLFGKPPAPPLGTVSFAQAVFAGTFLAAANVATAAQRLLGQAPSNTVSDSQFTDSGSPDSLGRMTGWYQWRVLQYFFDNYAQLKKTKAGRNSRLVFCTWKDEAVYLVQPVMFQVDKSSASPLEYTYELMFKSTRRVRLQSGPIGQTSSYIPFSKDPNAISALIDTLHECRRVIQNSKKVIAALGADADHVLFEPMREMALMAKDLGGVGASLSDLPDSIAKELGSDNVTAAPTASNGIARRADPSIQVLRRDDVTNVRIRKAGALVQSLSNERSDNPSPNVSIDAHPAANIFNNPKQNYDYLSQVQLGDLKPKASLVAKIAEERNRVRRLTRLDYQNRLDLIMGASDQLEESLGLGSAAYALVHGTNVGASLNTATDEDFELIYKLNDVITQMAQLVITDVEKPQSKIDAIANVAGLASKSGIAFQIPRSKFSVPFPYGSTLEMLSARYLDDPKRWHEIAALNGLQSPYVDEVGFSIPLIVNGAGNQVMVADSTHLFNGQPVWIGSTAVNRTRRTITHILRLSSTQYLVSVDGDSDLDRYSVLAHADLQTFLPNTVNSQQIIYIPSDIDPGIADFRTKAVPGVDQFDHLITIAGLDLLLTPKNDLVITQNGDNRWAVGMQSIIQMVRIGLDTKKGSVLDDPTFGLPIAVGSSNADTDAKDLAKSAQEMFRDNPAFSSIDAVKVSIVGGTTQIGMAVTLSGTNNILPLTFDVQ